MSRPCFCNQNSCLMLGMSEQVGKFSWNTVIFAIILTFVVAISAYVLIDLLFARL